MRDACLLPGREEEEDDDDDDDIDDDEIKSIWSGMPSQCA